jgi:peptidoglycan hydrolase CwlO-like protein
MILTFAVSFGVVIAFFTANFLSRRAKKIHRISEDKIRHVRNKVKGLKSELQRLKEDSLKCDKIVDLVEKDIDETTDTD